jgi:hypothetical protein
MQIRWNHDFDRELERARESGKPILLDFSAAPM